MIKLKPLFVRDDPEMLTQIFFSLLVAIQFFITISVRKSSLGLPKNPSGGIKNLSELSSTLRKPTTMVLLMISDFLFVRGCYSQMGIPDTLYVLHFSGFLEVLFFFKFLPFTMLIAQLCPQGCEGSLMAFLMSVVALALIVSGYLGVAGT